MQLTTPGTIMGTPAYMAPEQAGGPIDHRADLFSLGCVLYRAATGRLPFPGSSPMEILRNIAVQAPRSPRKLNLEIPAALDQFMLRLLAKEREQRPVSAAVVAKVLKTLEQQLSATIQVLLTPPVALPLEPGAKPAVAPPLAQLVQAGPRAAPAPQIQTTPQNDGKNPGVLAYSQGERPAIVGASLNPQQKLLLGGGAAAVLLGVLLLVLLVTLLWPGGSRPTTGQPIAGKEKDKDGHSTGPPVKIVPSPPDLVVDLAAGAAQRQLPRQPSGETPGPAQLGFDHRPRRGDRRPHAFVHERRAPGCLSEQPLSQLLGLRRGPDAAVQRLLQRDLPGREPLGLDPAAVGLDPCEG